MYQKTYHIHFVGIGGIGMSGIAELLLNLGYQVSGSDLKATDITRRLAGLGGRICIGHAAGNIQDDDVVVISSAVGEDNPEVIAVHTTCLSETIGDDVPSMLREYRAARAGRGRAGAARIATARAPPRILDPSPTVVADQRRARCDRQASRQGGDPCTQTGFHARLSSCLRRRRAPPPVGPDAKLARFPMSL